MVLAHSQMLGKFTNFKEGDFFSLIPRGRKFSANWISFLLYRYEYAFLKVLNLTWRRFFSKLLLVPSLFPSIFSTLSTEAIVNRIRHWSTLGFAPSRHPKNRRWDQVPGWNQRLLLCNQCPSWMPETHDTYMYKGWRAGYGIWTDNV